MQKNEVNVSASEVVARGESLFRSVDQSQVHNLGAGPFELLSNPLAVSL